MTVPPYMISVNKHKQSLTDWLGAAVTLAVAGLDGAGATSAPKAGGPCAGAGSAIDAGAD